MPRFNSVSIFWVTTCLVLGCDRSDPEPAQATAPDARTSGAAVMPGREKQERPAHPIVDAARRQIGQVQRKHLALQCWRQLAVDRRERITAAGPQPERAGNGRGISRYHRTHEIVGRVT